MSKMLNDLALLNPDIISEIRDETYINNGYWIYLQNGWYCTSSEAAIHEMTVKECLDAFKRISQR